MEKELKAEDAKKVLTMLKKEFHYSPSEYLFPMNEVKPSANCFYVNLKDISEKKMVEIKKLILSEFKSVYYTDENLSLESIVEETDVLDFKHSYEAVYTDKSFEWLIYVSHEGTITFAGSIVSKIKSLLK